MRIGIEANGVFGWRGPSRNINSIIQVLGEIDKENEYYLFTGQSSMDYIPKKDNLHPICVPSKKNIPWLSVSLPLAVRKYKLDVFLFPQANFWLWKAMKSVVIIRTSTLGAFFPTKIDYLQLWLKKRKLRKIADNVIVCSDFNAGQVAVNLKIKREEIEVIYNGIAPTFMDPDIFPRKDLGNYILYVGGTEPRKNLKRLLEAFKILVKKGYKERLVLVGGKYVKSEPTLTDIEKIVIELGLKEKVIFMGVVKDIKKLAGLYKGARQLVFPSLWEEFGMIPVEAMACGCPVAASNISSIPEVVGDAGLFFDPYNVEDMACKMELMLNDSLLCAELIKKGKERIKMFDWKILGRKLISVLEETAKKR